MIRKNDKIYDFVVLPFSLFHSLYNYIYKKKPLILKGLQKNNKNISTHHLTVLIMSVILRIEQKINGYLNIDKYPFVKEERV